MGDTDRHETHRASRSSLAKVRYETSVGGVLEDDTCSVRITRKFYELTSNLVGHVLNYITATWSVCGDITFCGFEKV